MKRAYWKHLIRSIGQNKSRFFSILIIIAIGVGFFSGVRASGEDMRLSADEYVNEYQLTDFRVVSTVGLDEEDIAALGKAFPDLTVEAGYTADCLMIGEGEEAVVSVFSLPGKLNALRLTEGRLPERATECLVDGESFYSAGELGETVRLKSGSDAPITDTLSEDAFTIVGKVATPYYLSSGERGTASVGSGRVSCALYLTPEVFESEVYTVAYLRSETLNSYNCYSTAYEEKRDALEEELEAFAETRQTVRYDRLKADAEAQLSDARQKVADGRQQLADGEAALRDAADKLQKAADELESGEAQLAEGKAELSRRRQSYTEGITAGEAELSASEKALADSRAALDAGQTALAEGEAEYQSGVESLAAPQAQLAALTEAGLGETPEAQMLAQQIEAAEQPLRESRAVLDEQAAVLAASKAEYEAGEKQLADGKAALEKSRDEGAAALAAAEREIAANEKKLSEGRTEYQNGKAEYDKSEAEFRQEKADAEAEIADAEEQIADGEAALLDLPEPHWYCFTRDDLPGFSEFGQNAERIDRIAAVFPVFFLLVAALVCLASMTRLVEEERGQIGVFKALGYPNAAVRGKYLAYALTATLIGSVLGVLIGFQLFPRVIVSAYSMMYHLPRTVAPFHWGMAAAAVGSAVVIVCLTVSSCCYAVMRERPAGLMRPKAPGKGKRVLLERVGFIWKRCSFSWKVSLRNLFRYKKRMFMAVVGIAGCTALLLTGFGLNDSISDIVTNQYDRVWTYQALAVLDDPDENTVAALTDTVRAADPNGGLLPVYQRSCRMESEEKALDVSLFVVEDTAALSDFVSLHSRTDLQTPYDPADGAVLTEKAATLLGVTAGDALSVSLGDAGVIEVPVTAIAEQYVQHYLYLSAEQYEMLSGEAATPNVALVRYGLSEADEKELSAALLSNDKVLQMNLMSDSRKNFGDITHMLIAVVVVLILSAGCLAVVVLYNLTSINLTERVREIATLKVLGFTPTEVAQYLFRENVMLTLLGIIAGLGLGRLLTAFVVQVAEIDMVMFGREIKLSSYLLAAGLTLVFSLLVNQVMKRPLQKIDMIESLKSVE